jgi:hypothetical protein
MNLRIDAISEDKVLGITRFTVWREDVGIAQVSLLSSVVRVGNYEPLLHHALDRKKEAKEAVEWENPTALAARATASPERSEPA